MKKMLIFGLFLLVSITLSACGLGDNGDERPLRVGMDLSYPPFETIEGGEPYGISVDVAELFGEFIGREVEIVNTNFGSLIPAVNAGDIDIIIASMSKTEERAQSVDFSDPYFYFKIISLVNQDFADQHNLDGDSTTEDILAIDDTKFIGIAAQVSSQIPRDLGKDVTEATELSTAIQEVAQGSSDILMMSSFPVTNGHRANPDTTMVIWDPFQSSPISMAVEKGNEELLAQANEFIATMHDDGGAYDVLRERWDDEVQALLERYGLEFFINE